MYKKFTVSIQYYVSFWKKATDLAPQVTLLSLPFTGLLESYKGALCSKEMKARKRHFRRWGGLRAHTRKKKKQDKREITQAHRPN